MDVKEIIKVLMFLNMDFSVKHTNDYSEVEVISNNELPNRSVFFDRGTRKVWYMADDIFDEEE